jgi:hypothetical protein
MGDLARSMAAHPANGRPRKRTLFRINWAAIVTVIVALVVGIVIGMGIQFQVTLAADPYHGAPVCTDAIADAGGICHGEPISAVETVSPGILIVPCAQEDSHDCFWDAATMGNGQGTSFVNLAGIYYYPRD